MFAQNKRCYVQLSTHTPCTRYSHMRLAQQPYQPPRNVWKRTVGHCRAGPIEEEPWSMANGDVVALPSPQTSTEHNNSRPADNVTVARWSAWRSANLMKRHPFYLFFYLFSIGFRCVLFGKNKYNCSIGQNGWLGMVEVHNRSSVVRKIIPRKLVANLMVLATAGGYVTDERFVSYGWMLMWRNVWWRFTDFCCRKVIQ